MIDLFGRKRRQELFDRAYAEFVSGNYSITEKNLTELINEGSKNFYVFNLRAQTYLALNKLHLAFRDAITSTQLEANIEKNKDAYDIRNFITSQLKSGEIEADIYELTYFFEIGNVFGLFEEHCKNAIEGIHGSDPKYHKLELNESKKVKLLFIAYNYLFFNLQQAINRSRSFDNEFFKRFKEGLAKAIKKNFDTVEKEVGENLKHPFFWLPIEVHFKPYFERTISYYSEEHILPFDKWLFWLGEDELETLTNYVFKNGKEVNRLALVVEVEFLSKFILEIKESIIPQPMVI